MNISRTARIPPESCNQLPPTEFAAILTQKLEKVILRKVKYIIAKNHFFSCSFYKQYEDFKEKE